MIRNFQLWVSDLEEGKIVQSASAGVCVPWVHLIHFFTFGIGRKAKVHAAASGASSSPRARSWCGWPSTCGQLALDSDALAPSSHRCSPPPPPRSDFFPVNAQGRQVRKESIVLFLLCASAIWAKSARLRFECNWLVADLRLNFSLAFASFWGWRWVRKVDRSLFAPPARRTLTHKVDQKHAFTTTSTALLWLCTYFKDGHEYTPFFFNWSSFWK